MKPSLILVNPSIYDFAAYDLWSKPLGLLTLASFLRRSGFRVDLIDCMNVHNPEMKTGPLVKMPKRRKFGTGKYFKQKVSKPDPLEDVPRAYSRYGISRKVLEHELKKLPRPEAILVTSLMTYWYPGVKETIILAKKVYPEIPVILGGIYAILCSAHALKNSGADTVYAKAEVRGLLDVLDDYGVCPPLEHQDYDSTSFPAFDMLGKIDYVCIQTSTGCPYSCQYCASRFLNPTFSRRDPNDVIEEILYWHKKFLVNDFAFYDDALLVSSENHFEILLEKIAKLKLNLRFHTPNAIHAGEVTEEIAVLMKRAGFKTIRLGLETSDFSFHRNIDNKISEGDFERAVKNLLSAEFENMDIGAYILVGLPGQSIESVKRTIDFVDSAGALPFLSEYSPIPHTGLWEEAVKSSEYDLVGEPLFHNNSLLPCWSHSQREELPLIKKRVSEIRNKYRGAINIKS
ncbi:B12-binding domain-containing radical SAM protein [Thermodesulfobacteriota bacterium]